ncbi:hypothetical protein SAMN06265222_108188 [Neorhodopirellula lusitana]|uniref:Transposase n=1 Tax=Neorhodopirellula lusitana TaxID=445327 RepID=A0ABY1QC58_9BACT|nr:hypothetical protein [Neorhodopirellula lusitana]SMP64231.1 hypothetical protein SAMN06265222_108188 [Neorhodopirellula lusitana]
MLQRGTTLRPAIIRIAVDRIAVWVLTRVRADINALTNCTAFRFLKRMMMRPVHAPYMGIR